MVYKNKNKNKNTNSYIRQINYVDFNVFYPLPNLIFSFFKFMLFCYVISFRGFVYKLLNNSFFYEYLSNKSAVFQWFPEIIFMRFIKQHIFAVYIKNLILNRCNNLLYNSFKSNDFRSIESSIKYSCLFLNIALKINSYLDENTNNQNTHLFFSPFRNENEYEDFIKNFIGEISEIDSFEESYSLFLRFIIVTHFLSCCSIYSFNYKDNLYIDSFVKFISNPLVDLDKDHKFMLCEYNYDKNRELIYNLNYNFIKLFISRVNIILSTNEVVHLTRKINDLVYRDSKKTILYYEVLKSICNSKNNQYYVLFIFNDSYFYKTLFHQDLKSFKKPLKKRPLFINNIKFFLSRFYFINDNLKIKYVLNSNKVLPNVIETSRNIKKQNFITEQNIKSKKITSPKKNIEEVLAYILETNNFISRLSENKKISIEFNAFSKQIENDDGFLFLKVKDFGVFNNGYLGNKEYKRFHKVIRDIDIELSLNDQDFESLCLSLGSLILDIKNDSCYIIGFDYNARNFNSIIISFFQKNCLVPIDINILKSSKKLNNRIHNLNAPNLALINILKNLLHVLKKIVRSEDQDNLYGPIQDSFEYMLNIGRPVKNKIIKYRSLSNEALQEIILNVFEKFYENIYSAKFEKKYVKIFEKLFMSSKGPDDLIKLHKFWDKFSSKFKSSILVKEVSAFLNSEQWFFCSNILKENFSKLEKKDHQFFWDLLSIGFSPAFLSRCFHKISDESFDKILAGYGVKFLNSKVLEFVDGFSKYYEDISNSNINISQVFYKNSNLLFSNPDRYLNLMIKEDIKNYCIKNKIIRKLNQACFILENNGKESDDFILCSNKISESYNFNNDLFFGVFVILVKNSEPASLLRLRKLSSQIDVLILPFAKARCELVSSSNSNSS